MRHLVAKPNGDGSLRYYWQPARKLTLEGWPTEQLSNDEGEAIKRATELNDELDRRYQAGRPPRDGSIALTSGHAGIVRPRRSVWQLIDNYRNPPRDRPAVDPEALEEERAVDGYDYNGLKPTTRRSYDYALNYIARWLGPLPCRKVTEAMLLERLKKIAAQRHSKGALLGRRKVAISIHIARIGRLLFHASRTLVDPKHPCYVAKSANPWAGLRGREQPQRGQLWDREGRDFMVNASEALGLYSIAAAIRINWWLGQREGDMLRLPASMSIEGAAHEIVQSKTAGSVHLHMAMVPELVQVVTELRARQRAAGLHGIHLLIDERFRRSWREDQFREAFHEARELAVHLVLFVRSTRATATAWPACLRG
jgi:hypothetical protein